MSRASREDERRRADEYELLRPVVEPKRPRLTASEMAEAVTAGAFLGLAAAWLFNVFDD